MSITATAFKSLTMADSCLLSSPSSLFHNITKSHVFSPPSKPLTLQFSCLNSSPSLSLSLAARTHRSPVLTHVAQTSDWAQQEGNADTVQAQDEKQEEPGLLDWEPNGEEDEGFVEPPEEAKIFVGNLPYDVDSEKLAMLFDKAGVVEIAEVIYNRETDRSRGFGFVTMSTVEEAEKAVEKFSGYDYDGRQLTVNKASPRGAQPERPPRRNFEPAASIYVGNLPWDIDSTRLEQVFSEHGKVVSARVVYDRDSGRSRGFGFVTMSTETEMNDAVAALDGQTLDGRTIRVNVAEDRPPRRSSF
ncbi:hypothetical protein PHAVU_009G171500 [Phaseolus vulgaris]|uniref:31 kDa ribonucleoprotein n=1 Tax=Phaseolus vulgaris TaxID=3885 RepID=T2DNQ6_PHAVU|nr:hypothetical protein PHAVU_009G171500g [Phaseolus vulgaris]AGV54482.1 31 kDa ribonucleoprotein [Phaseolus vulgaris]ESW09982.1 hypothetical protein PHAVU_009G171500g [Phaseolus vulgaris]